MNIDLTVTANLTKADVEKAVREAVERQFPTHEVKEVTFRTETRYYDRMEQSSYQEFVGCDIKLIPKVPQGMGVR